MNKRLHWLVSSTLCTSAFLCSPVMAQSMKDSPAPGESATEQTSGVEEIIVTAQKRSQALSDVGISVVAATGEQLATVGVTDVGDLAKIVPGFTAAESDQGIPVYTLRGVGFNSTQLSATPTVSVYLDEAGLPFPLMTVGAVLDLERVEVLKGPQGTLFGQNATGGSINFIANKPTDKFEAGIDVSYGRFNTLSASGYVSGPLAEGLNARLAANYTRGDDWQYSYTRDDTAGRVKKGSARLLLDWEPADSLKLSLNVNGWFDKSDNQRGQFIDIRLATPNSPLANPGLATLPKAPRNNRAADWDPAVSPFTPNPDRAFDLDRDNNFYQGVLRADWEASDSLTLTSLTNYARVRQFTTFDWDATRLFIALGGTDGTAKTFSQELRASGDVADGAIKYVVGAAYQKDHIEETPFQEFFQYSAAPFISNSNPADAKNETIGVFGNVDWDITPELTVTGGARYSEAKHEYVGCSADPGDGRIAALFEGVSNALRGAFGQPPTSGIFQGGQCITLGPAPDFLPFKGDVSFKEDNISWRANVNWKPSPGTLLYASVNRGYKAGLYPVVNATTFAQIREVRPEQLTAYEVGVKTTLFDRTLQFNASAYYYDYKDKQLFSFDVDPIFGLINILTNIPKSRVQGFDVDLTWAPIPGFTIRPALSYVDSRIGEFQGYDVFQNSVPLEGNRFSLAPKWNASLGADYEFPVNANLDAFVGGNVLYNSKTYADLAASPNFHLKSFATLDLRAGVASPDGTWKATVWGRNVTDTYYWMNVLANTDTNVRLTGMPATYGVSVSYKF